VYKRIRRNISKKIGGNIDNRIEPIPFRPEDFYNGGNFADEIRKTGKAVDI